MAFPPPAEALALLVGAALAALALANLRATARWAAQPVEPAGPWRPRATVVVPCRGEQPGFAENVRAMAAQDYPSYELLFVVDGEDDPAARALRAVQAEVPRARVLLAEPEGVGAGGGSGKIVAMLTGAARADPASEVLVFADADARPGPRWLASLAAPLAEPSVGAATGFPWYTADARPTFWTALRDAWAAMLLDGMAWERFRTLWGGSMAVRRADFERSTIRQEWARSVADDAALTTAVKGLGLRVAFAPGALVASPEDWGARQVLDWMMREYALTRRVKPRAFRALLLVHGLATAVLLAGLALLALGPTPLLRLAGAMLLVPAAADVARAVLRARLAARALPGTARRPRRERALQRLLAAVLPAFVLLALLRARRLAVLRWRGRTYDLRARA